MEESKSNLYIVAIVGIIAVVALVIMVTGESKGRSVYSGTSTAIDTAGQMYATSASCDSGDYCGGKSIGAGCRNAKGTLNGICMPVGAQLTKPIDCKCTSVDV